MAAPSTTGSARDAPLAPDPPHSLVRLCGWGLAAMVVAVAHNRLWASPNLDAFARIASDWGGDPFSTVSSSDYLLTNLSLPTIARLTAMTTPQEYAQVHLAVALLGSVACVAMSMRRFGYRTARTLVVLLAVSPGTTVVMQWLGQPDALMLPLGVALVLVRRRGAFVVLALIAGLTHPEQAVLMVSCAAVVRGLVLSPTAEVDLPMPRPPLRRVPSMVGADLLYGVAAVGIGRLVTELYLRGFDIALDRPRSAYLKLGVDILAEHHMRAPLSLLYLLWGPLWIVVIGVIVIRLRARPSPLSWPWAVLGVLALLAVLPVALTLDETRVYAMLTAPLLPAAAALLAHEIPAARPRALASASAVLLAVCLIVPGGFTAGEDAWATEIPMGEFLDFLRDGDAPGPLFFWLLGPFDFVFPDVGGR